MNFEESLDVFRRRESSNFRSAVDVVLNQVQSPHFSISDTADLVMALAESGDQVQLSDKNGPYADVPSTGGPASLSTLICPLLIAARGIRVPKISATGSVAGAIDTMALVPDFRWKISQSEFSHILSESGFVHTEQTPEMCPADKVLISARRERKLMANPHLAAASLLAKKIIIKGTISVFDFRVGSTGNIGATPESAKQAAHIFYSVAERLGIVIQCVLTDNRSFPSTALGRIESLQLLWEIVGGKQLHPLDKIHLETCVELAAYACTLANPSTTRNQHSVAIRSAIRRGDIREQLQRHLSAQGGKMEDLEQLLRSSRDRSVLQILAQSDGFWIPPSLKLASTRIKQAQKKILDVQSAADVDAGKCVGLQLLAAPGQFVEAGEPVLELRFPRKLAIDTVGLEGRIVPFPARFPPKLVHTEKS